MILLLALVLAAGVAPPCQVPQTVRVGPGISAEIAKATKYAIKRWNDALGRTVFVLTSRDQADIVISTEPQHLLGDYIGYWYISEGRNCSRGGRVVLYTDKAWCPERYRQVITHELGHALGIMHDVAQSRRDLMWRLVPACGGDLNTRITLPTIRKILALLPEDLVRSPIAVPDLLPKDPE